MVKLHTYFFFTQVGVDTVKDLLRFTSKLQENIQVNKNSILHSINDQSIFLKQGICPIQCKSVDVSLTNPHMVTKISTGVWIASTHTPLVKVG